MEPELLVRVHSQLVRATDPAGILGRRGFHGERASYEVAKE